MRGRGWYCTAPLGLIMYEESLLERIRRLETSPEWRGARDISRGVRSVVNHLQRLLNTRQGGVLIADDYGMPDFTNVPGEDLTAVAQDIERIINQVIQKYEPRLDRVRVHFDPQPGEFLTLRFRLEADMISHTERGKTVPVTFETIVTSDGKVRIET